jgi:hypothetical protein
MSVPSITALPAELEIYPVRMFMVVDFPAPFGPRKPRICPGCAVKEMLSTALMLP